MKEYIFDPTENIPKPEPIRNYSLFLPLLLTLIVLDFNTARDCVSLFKHLSILRASNAQAVQYLQQTSQKEAFVEKFRENLTTLAENDPVAAKLKAELFPKKISSQSPLQPPGN